MIRNLAVHTAAMFAWAVIAVYALTSAVIPQPADATPQHQLTAAGVSWFVCDPGWYWVPASQVNTWRHWGFNCWIPPNYWG